MEDLCFYHVASSSVYDNLHCVSNNLSSLSDYVISKQVLGNNHKYSNTLLRVLFQIGALFVS